MREVTSPGEKAEAWNTRLKPGLGIEMHSNQSKKWLAEHNRYAGCQKGEAVTIEVSHQCLRSLRSTGPSGNSTSTHAEWTAHQHTQNGQHINTRRMGAPEEEERERRKRRFWKKPWLETWQILRKKSLIYTPRKLTEFPVQWMQKYSQPDTSQWNAEIQRWRQNFSRSKKNSAHPKASNHKIHNWMNLSARQWANNIKFLKGNL